MEFVNKLGFHFQPQFSIFVIPKSNNNLLPNFIKNAINLCHQQLNPSYKRTKTDL